MNGDAAPTPEPSTVDAARVRDVLLDALPAMVGYWDRDLRNVVANAAYVEFFGRSPDALRGRHIRDLLGDELFAKNEPYLRAALAGEPQLFDRELIDQSGVKRHTQASYTPDVVDGQVRGIAVLVTDVTARRASEHATAMAEARFRALFTTAPIGTFLMDATGVILDANRSASDLLMRPTSELIGTSLVEFSPAAGHAALHKELADVLSGERLVDLELQLIRGDGSTLWAQVDATALDDPVERSTQILAQIQDVGERRAHQTKLEELALTDPLTGLLNRRGLIDRLANAPRGALVSVDLNRFKLVNDLLGHQAGDDVLTGVARVLQDRLRAGDAVARMGGDEFVVFLSHASLSDAERLASDMARRIEEARLGVPSQPVRASVGAVVIKPGFSPIELLAQADQAMYAHKRRGR